MGLTRNRPSGRFRPPPSPARSVGSEAATRRHARDRRLAKRAARMAANHVSTAPDAAGTHITVGRISRRVARDRPRGTHEDPRRSRLRGMPEDTRTRRSAHVALANRRARGMRMRRASRPVRATRCAHACPRACARDAHMRRARHDGTCTHAPRRTHDITREESQWTRRSSAYTPRVRTCSIRRPRSRRSRTRVDTLVRECPQP